MLEAPKKEKEKVRKSSATAEEAEMESRFHEVPRHWRHWGQETATALGLNLMTYLQ